MRTCLSVQLILQWLNWLRKRSDESSLWEINLTDDANSRGFFSFPFRTWLTLQERTNVWPWSWLSSSRLELVRLLCKMDFTPSWTYAEYRLYYEFFVTINKFSLINIIIPINRLRRNRLPNRTLLSSREIAARSERYSDLLRKIKHQRSLNMRIRLRTKKDYKSSIRISFFVNKHLFKYNFVLIEDSITFQL